jgi:hypothetical protein
VIGHQKRLNLINLYFKSSYFGLQSIHEVSEAATITVISEITTGCPIKRGIKKSGIT